MSEIAAWIRAHLPFERAVLDQAVAEAKRLAALERRSEEAWLAHVAREPRALEALCSVVVPPESWLFRHAPAFDLVREALAGWSSRRIRIASLGCARGPEAFSLAAVAASMGRTADDCEIVGMDWSAENLAAARTGRCPPLAQRGMIPAWARDAFEPDREGAIRLREGPLSMIRWQHADITRLTEPAPCDIVFCRNVAIYLDDAARQRLAVSLARATTPDGMLCLGHADPAVLWQGAFEVIERTGAFAFRRASQAMTPPASRAANVVAASASLPKPAPVRRMPTPHAAAQVPLSIESAQSLADEGRLAEAEAQTQALLQSHAMMPAAWHLMAVIRLAQSRNDEAEACLRKVVYLHPDDALALVQLAALADRRGDTRAADLLRLRAARLVRDA
jgi:chemotaxis protein methyltransferase WspC